MHHVTVYYVYGTMFRSQILHGSWEFFYLQRFDYTQIIILLPEEDYQSIIETLQIKNFDNYCELFKIQTLYRIGERCYG